MRAWPLALLPLVAACGTSGTTTTPSPTRTVVVTHPPVPLPTIEGKPVLFSTPDGQVSCDVESAYARCDVRTHTWTSPAKPSDCHNTWGSAVEFSLGSKGAFMCWFGTPVLGAKRVLPYGQAVQVGLVTCRAARASVECTGEGNGFVMGTASYRLY